jgi:putative transposase
MAKTALVLALTSGEREELRELLKSGVLPVRTVIRALALLRMDAGMSAPQVAEMLELTGQGVRQIAKRYNESGLEAAVYEGARPGKKPALDAAQTQRVIALACGPPPSGHARWSVRLLAAEVRKRKLVPGVGREVIRIALQDHDLKPWREKNVVRTND